ncbi:MAG TPA: diacylglycerol kinase family protein, partial [Gaiellaceae bacterium]|nr:diacylglycerol kinase family protein [Gaiellaceae bacterium]
MPKGFLIVNPRSGTGEETPALVAAAAELGIETHVLSPGDDPAACVGEADVVGAAGGDGTLGAVASVALERGVPFVCVPFGTRNHFARDLGLDLDDPIAALAAFSSGVSRVVDVGHVGDRVFLNNVSIGAYATLVHRSALQVVRSLHRPERVVIDGAPVVARVVLFANNAYRLDGTREQLDSGELHLYVAHGLLKRSWNERVGLRFAVDGVREVAIDGEAEHVEPPFEVRLDPGG